MLLDLWTFSTVLNDVVDLATQLRDNGTFSLGFLFCCFVLSLISYIAWRSTDIPQDVPSAPAPPFVITIQNSSNVGGLRRQNLSDIRVISPATYTDFVSRHPFGRLGRTAIRNQNTTRSQSQPVSTPAPGNQDHTSTRHSASRTQQQQHQAGRSFILGFLRHPLATTRGLVPARLVLNLLPPSIFVATGRVIRHQQEQQRRHHNRQQLVHTQRVSRPQSPTPDSPENQAAAASIGESQAISQPLANGESVRSVPFVNSADTVNSNSNPREVASEQENSLDEGDTTPMDLESENNHPEELTTRPENIIDSNIDDTKTPETQESVTMATNQDEAPSTGPPSSDALPEVKFTLKFLNDTQIEVTTHSGEKIGDFKRRHFTRELSENKIVRLIFNGRVMDQDNRTLQECGIFNQCVVHCLVVTPQQPTHNQGSGGGSNSAGLGGRNSNNRAGQRGPEPGMFFMSFVGIILMFMWFVCINFGNHLFTQSAVVSLSILTIMFLAGIFTFYAPFQQQNNNNVNVNT